MQQDRKQRFSLAPTLMSSADNVADAPAPPSGVAAELRLARERLGWELPEMAEHLRIRLPYLEAIEAGRVDTLPSPAYALNFVRSYSAALGLDPDEIGRRFRAEAAAVNQKTKLNFPVPVPERGVPAGAMMLLGAVVAIGAYIGWYRISGDQQVAAPVREVPQRLAPLAEPPVPVKAVAVLPAVIAPSAPAATPVAVEASRIAIHAKADSFVQVRDRQGQALLNRVLRAGETWTAPPRTAVLLTTGNAAATEIVLDGTASAVGTDAAARRDMLLDPAAIKDGKFVVARPAAPKPPAADPTL